MKRKFIATVDGSPTEFSAELVSASRVRLFFGDRVVELDVHRIGEDHYLALKDSQVFHLGFTRNASEWQAYLDGEVLSFDLKDEKMLLRQGLGGGAGAGASGDIKSPMPGRVVKVLVTPGQAVVAGEAVVVVEAMKMENEFKAKKAGTIKEIRVAPGDTIEGGAVLVTVE